MRRFLYISPFFPPMSRVGALRPLKFARHLPSYGWAPVVVSDLRSEDAVEPRLLEAIPDEVRVFRTYGRQAQRLLETATTTATTTAGLGKSGASKVGLRGRLRLPEGEDINPLGRYMFETNHALRAAREALRAEPSCEAIMVNADPYPALIVGARLARETGLPLIQDLRDPWSCCDLRRQLRPAPQRAWVDHVERRAVEPASAVILNTETARRDYLSHYGDLPSDRFHCIRNHVDTSLFTDTPFPEFPTFTLAFLGNFRRFVDGETLLQALAQVRRAGVGPEQLRLVITGSIPDTLWTAAEQLGVADQIADHPYVAYLDLAAFMRRADMLVSFSHPTNQRIPAKIFDYLASDRPMLVIADNPELTALVEHAPGARVHGLGDDAAIAASILDGFRAGRGQVFPRPDLGIDSATASRRLAAILDTVTRSR